MFMRAAAPLMSAAAAVPSPEPTSGRWTVAVWSAFKIVMLTVAPLTPAALPHAAGKTREQPLLLIGRQVRPQRDQQVGDASLQGVLCCDHVLDLLENFVIRRFRILEQRRQPLPFRGQFRLERPTVSRERSLDLADVVCLLWRQSQPAADARTTAATCPRFPARAI